MSGYHGLPKQLRSVLYPLCVVIAVASLVDLFINRLLFRAGPDVFAHMPIDAFYLALVGRVSLSLEQLLLFVVLGSATILLLIQGRDVLRVIGALLASIVACSALLYAPLPVGLSWAVSCLLIFSVASVIPLLAWLRVMNDRELSTGKWLVLAALLSCLILGFILPLYYRMYLLLGAAQVATLPFPLEAYEAGIYIVMVAMPATFLYALSVPSPGFNLDYRNFAVAAIVPTVLIVPTVYGLFASFFFAQILAMVVAMSTDFVLSHDVLRLIVVLSWFLLVAIIVLLMKGRQSGSKALELQGIGLILIMSTTFLFNYPYYLMLGTTGMLFLCYPVLTSPERDTLALTD